MSAIDDKLLPEERSFGLRARATLEQLSKRFGFHNESGPIKLVIRADIPAERWEPVGKQNGKMVYEMIQAMGVSAPEVG